MKSIPNSFIDTRYKGNGSLKQRRKFDEYGNAYLDIEDKHNHVPCRHAYDIKGSSHSHYRVLSKKI